MAVGFQFIRVLMIVLMAGSVRAAPVPRDPAAAKQTFNEISSRLEVGGDLFVVANVEGMLESYVETMRGFMSTIPAQPGSDEAQMVEAVNKVAAFLKSNGLYAIKGLGFSVVPREDGKNSVTSFVSREPEAAVLPFWRAVVGVSPTSMDCLKYLPADTVMARSGTADWRYIWALIKAGVRDIGGDDASQGFNAGLSMAQAQLGVSIDDLINSLSPEGALSIQLSRSATSPIPVGTQMVQIPQPSLLLITQVSNDTILDTVKRLAKEAMGQELPATKVGDATVYTLPLPIPSPVPVSITLARHGKYLLLGSTLDVVNRALAGVKDGAGLLADAEFKAAFPGKMEANNGVIYVSSRFSEAVSKLQMDMMNQAPSDDESREMIAFMKGLMKDQNDYACGLTIMNYRSGVKTSGWSTTGGRELVSSAAIAPVGLMAAIAIPSFVKARTASQMNACINNLRQLDAAKEQWAMAASKSDGDAPVEAEVLQYIRGAAMPVCPQGGAYTLNPIGQNPTCSHPEHSLNY